MATSIKAKPAVEWCFIAIVDGGIEASTGTADSFRSNTGGVKTVDVL